MEDKINQIIQQSLEEINQSLDTPVNFSAETRLFGEGGALDSMSLVSLVVNIEERVQDEFGVEIILANEKAMSQKNSPFATQARLATYTIDLLEAEMIHA